MENGTGILSLFPKKKPILGMIHLKGNSDEAVFEKAKEEIRIYEEGGIDGIMLENYYGNYYQLEKIMDYAAQGNLSLPYGVNCLNVDAMCFELAARYHADFMQIDSVVGHVKPRDEATLEEFFKLYRAKTDAYLIGGVRFKYQPMLSEHSLAEDLKIGMRRCDAIAVTENATGQETSMSKIEEFRAGVGDFPLVIAAGMTKENAGKQLLVGDMAIVGSYFKDTHKDTGDVYLPHVKEFMDVVNQIREGLE